MNIIIPMAGFGSRFSDFDEPKPLIDVNNKPMFLEAVNSLNELIGLRRFIILKEHFDKYNLCNIIRNYYDESTFRILDSVTIGQATTVYHETKNIKNNNPVVIFNCDSCFEFEELEKFINVIQRFYYGGILYFQDTSIKWSFIKINDDSLVQDISEKVSISKYATIGLYIFKNAEIYNKYYLRSLKDFPNGETFVSNVYKSMLLDDRLIYSSEVDRFGCFGTPEELEKYNSGFRYK